MLTELSELEVDVTRTILVSDRSFEVEIRVVQGKYHAIVNGVTYGESVRIKTARTTIEKRIQFCLERPPSKQASGSELEARDTYEELKRREQIGW